MVRRALAMAAGEQYVRLAVGFGLIASISRLLTPAEVGITVVGTGFMMIVLALREFATADFLIQRPEIDPHDVRTSLTVMVLLTGAIAGAVFALAPQIAAFYGEPGLERFLKILAAAGTIEAFAAPVTGLLRRRMAFGSLALINVSSTSVNAVAAIGLAFAGFSYMSIAWAAIAAAATMVLLSYCIMPAPWILRPSLRSWRPILAFGGFNGATYVVNRIYESLPQLVLGRFLPPSAVAYYNRANLMSAIPDKIVLTSVFSVAFPALATEVRANRRLKEPYLRALGYITVLYWPALCLLALLAYPAVIVLLGRQWVEAVPLLRIMSLAALAWFPVILTTPVLLAVGANRERLMSELIGRAVSAVILCVMAWFGLMAMVLSQFVVLPFQMLVALYFARRHLHFAWREIWGAVFDSALVTLCTLAAPVGVIAATGFHYDMPLGLAVLVALAALPGWAFGVWATGHPIAAELERITSHMARYRAPLPRRRA